LAAFAKKIAASRLTTGTHVARITFVMVISMPKGLSWWFALVGCRNESVDSSTI